MLVFVTAEGCSHGNLRKDSVYIDGYSESNYPLLDKSLGRYSCIVGRLLIDTHGIFFPLQPIEKNGIIDVGFSRILTALDDEYVRKNNLRGGRVYRVCGILRDATPFPICETNDCRWYKLEADTGSVSRN
jgi:hypothetical protein